jgi:hypothetical protein
MGSVGGAAGRCGKVTAMRVRVAVLVLVAAFGLAGCRSDPSVAAYVGSTRYSDDRVRGIADEAHRKLQEYVDAQQSASGASSQAVERPVTDQEVIDALVGRDVLKALAGEKKLTPLDVDPNQIAQQEQVPPDSEYVRLVAERDSYRLAILQKAKSVEPSEDDLREVYDNLVKASSGAYTGSYAQFKSSLAEQDTELIGRSAAVGREVTAEAGNLDVRVNPRFGTASLSLVQISDQQGGVHSLLNVPLTEQETGVKDLS